MQMRLLHKLEEKMLEEKMLELCRTFIVKLSIKCVCVCDKQTSISFKVKHTCRQFEIESYTQILKNAKKKPFISIYFILKHSFHVSVCESE